MITDQQKIQNLKKLHAKDGGKAVEEAPFTCPRCGIRPILFLGNREWNNEMPIVECLCFAPFSPQSEFKEIDIWEFPPTQNADQWGLFVQWKLSLPCEEEEEENE